MTSLRAITAISGATAAGGIGVAVNRDSTMPINRAVRRRIHPKRSPALKSVAEAISYLAGPHTHPFAAGALGLLIRWKRRSGGLAPGAASLAALAVDNETRIVIHQRRPPKAGRHYGRNRYGYPSGHVTASTAIAVAAASEMAGGLSRRQQSVVWATVAGVSIAVGWSRLYLDEHWMDDVVGGWMAGVAIGLGSVSLVARRS